MKLRVDWHWLVPGDRFWQGCLVKDGDIAFETEAYTTRREAADELRGPLLEAKRDYPKSVIEGVVRRWAVDSRRQRYTITETRKQKKRRTAEG